MIKPLLIPATSFRPCSPVEACPEDIPQATTAGAGCIPGPVKIFGSSVAGVTIVGFTGREPVGVEKTIKPMARFTSCQIVPLRPYCHKVYLAIDLLLPPLGALNVATLVAVGQAPGDIGLAGWP